MEDYQYGNGPIRVILIHGWFGDAHDFDPVFAAIDPEIFSFACLEFRGYGARKGQAGPYDIPTIAQDAVALADRLGWDRFGLIGHSMGGKAALRTAIDIPHRVERICGITPVWAGRSPFNDETVAMFRSAKAIPAVRAGIISNTTGDRLPPIWAKRIAEHSTEISTQDAFADYFESWALDDFSAEAKGVQLPTLVIAGAYDWAISPEIAAATWVANLANAELVILPDSGHYPANETPLSLAAHLTGFFSPT